MSASATLVLIIVLVIASLLPSTIKGIVYNGLMKEIQAERYDKAVTKLNKKIYRLLYGEFDRDLMLLRIYIVSQNYSVCAEHTRYLLTSELNSKQRYQVAQMSYYFFIDSENKEMCSFLLPYLNQQKHLEEYNFLLILYHVIIEKKSDDIIAIQSMIEKNQNSEPQQIGLLQYVLGLQYYYAHNNTEAKKQLTIAKNNLKNTPYHKKINKLLSKIH